MNKKNIILILLIATSLLTLSFVKTDVFQSPYQVVSNTDKADFAIRNVDLSDYKNWYRITEGNPNTGDPTGFLNGRHKGLEAYREVYINKIGETVNKGTAPYKYPVGTIVIKEEYKDKKAWEAKKKPSIKLMVKLDSGESPETGGWGFASKLDTRKIAKGNSGKAKFCASCHVFVAAQGDYVFMNSDFLATE